MEHKLDEFSDSQKVARLKERSRSKLSGDAAAGGADWGNDTAAAHMDGTVAAVDPKLRYIWISSAVLMLATVFVLTFG